MKDFDGKPGLRIESAASAIARDVIQQHLRTFAHVIRQDRVAGQSVIAAYVDGLAGSVAFVIAGRHGSREEVIEATIAKLRDAIDRDLKHLG
jgi:hypothetical protein